MKEEIIKHTKKIYTAMTKKDQSFKEKLKEISIEVLIIVFAVTLSIWLHSWSEEKHQEKEAQSFLFGLKEDMKNDITNLQSTKKILNETQKQMSFVKNLTVEQIDSITKNKQQINSGTNFINTIFNNGRYEGFKSSGKINTIKDEKLRNHILTYYQQTIPQISLIESSYEKLTTRYVDLLMSGKDDEDIKTTFQKKKTKIILSGIDNFIKSNQKNYDEAIESTKVIMAIIEKESEK